MINFLLIESFCYLSEGRQKVLILGKNNCSVLEHGVSTDEGEQLGSAPSLNVII